jgi:hypothetical protein
MFVLDDANRLHVFVPLNPRDVGVALEVDR